MLILAVVDWQHYMFMIPLIVLSIFLMMVILVQRGRGGGLTGALGGMGGQSAFGTKAGDLFTRITIVVAAIWVLLALASVKFLNVEGSRGGLNAADRGISLPQPPAGKAPADPKSPVDATAPGDAKAPADAGAPAGDAGKTEAVPQSAAPTSEPGGPAAPPPSSPEPPAKAADDAKP